ncbi:hypothetical protein PTKIN_Ptkin13bG0206900 [Pterospermum kingtungense]
MERFFIFALLSFLISSGTSKKLACSKKDMVISQGAVRSQPNGIPSYRVEIINVGKYAIKNIHLHCGMFSSANLVNPLLFKRLAPDNCLVNSGKPLASGTVIAFTYTTTFMYPLSVSSFTCST